eukprot:32160_1
MMASVLVLASYYLVYVNAANLHDTSCNASVQSGFSAYNCSSWYDNGWKNKITAPYFDPVIDTNTPWLYYWWGCDSDDGLGFNMYGFGPQTDPIDVNILEKDTGVLTHSVQFYGCANRCNDETDYYPLGPMLECSVIGSATWHPSPPPTFTPTEVTDDQITTQITNLCDTEAIGTYKDCDWYLKCSCDGYGYSMCIDYNNLMDNDDSIHELSEYGKSWAQGFIMCHKSDMRDILQTVSNEMKCDMIQHYESNIRTKCFLDNHLHDFYCNSLTSHDLLLLNEIHHENEIVVDEQCWNRLMEQWQFFQIILENDPGKSLFDAGIDIAHWGWILLNVATCTTRGALLDISRGGTSVTCFGLFMDDIPNLYEKTKEDMTKAGVYLLDVFEGSVGIDFSIYTNSSLVLETLIQEMDEMKGNNIIIQHFGENITLKFDQFIIVNTSIELDMDQDESKSDLFSFLVVQIVVIYHILFA